jgi:23S rRNA (pseudouridine1915-N3)-methyltransferase
VRLTILAIGRTKAGPEKTLCTDYLKRIPWAVELKEFEVKKALPPAEKQRQESNLLLSAVPDGAVVVVLDEAGKQLSSTELAEKMGQWQDEGRQDVALLIGGADGHTAELKGRADLTLAMGRMTWPHMLARVMVAEQLYRAWSILAGHPYHRA